MDQGFIYSLKRPHSKNILVKYQKACYLICSITNWYSTKFVQIMVPWSKWHRPGGHRVYMRLLYCSWTLPLGALGLYAVYECGIS